MSQQKTLIMTVGLPRSGKSTWAKSKGFPIVNPDSIRLAIHGEAFISLAEPFVWATAKAMVRGLFLAGHDAVILDATNISRARRDEWISRSWVRQFFEISTPKETCIERANQVGFPEEVIERMALNYEPPSEEELKEWER